MVKTIIILSLTGIAGVAMAARSGFQNSNGAAARPTEPPAPSIAANLVFFYYKDLAAAQRFYEEVIGLERVLDYGFATIHRVGPTSYIGLVDENRGMHKASEPKTVTLAFITDEVDAWFRHLSDRSVKLRGPVRDASRHPTRGFVAYDPEGYFLEFETFLDHPQNTKLREQLRGTPGLYPGKTPGTALPPGSLRPAGLGIRGTVFWLYYRDVPAAQRFMETALGQNLVVDQGFAKVYTASAAGFVGLVDETQGLHRFSDQKAVTVTFITPAVDAWYQRLRSQGVQMKEPLEEVEKGLVRAFVGLDPAGYYLEFHWYNPDPRNDQILDILGKQSP
ncbi:MAG: VOC family protein [Acidobacteriota bacterium]